jgi:hypothetical protein
MDLGALVAARAANVGRPSWSAIFIKAFALVADETPDLRRTYVKYPWGHLYEYPSSVASMAVEREFEGEPTIFLGIIKGPSKLPLAEIARRVRCYAEAPVTSVREFRVAITVARLPAPLRRALFWLGFQLARQRANYFGTFLLTGVSALGAELTRSPTTGSSVIHYGPIRADELTDVYLVFDHRVLDGLTAARFLNSLEQVLTGAIVDELKR